MSPSVWMKAAGVIPPLVISALLGIVFGALLPPAVELGMILAHLALAVVLATGRLEPSMVRLVWGGRPPTPGEAPSLDRLHRLADRHLADAQLILLIGRRRTPGVRAVGTRHVLLSPEQIHAHRTLRINDCEQLALIAHAAGQLHHGRTRCNLALTVFTWPWQLVQAIALATGQLVAWIPLVTLAWKSRIVVGVTAVILETTQGRTPSAIICGLFIGMSYLMPWWGRRWEHQLTLAADHYVTTHGLGEPLARWLLRTANDPATHDRADRLRSHPASGTSPTAPGPAREPRPAGGPAVRGLARMQPPIRPRFDQHRRPRARGPQCARPLHPAGWRDHTQPPWR